MKKDIRRCPQFCFGPCPTCGGTQYVHEDGTPATPEQMLEQIQRPIKRGLHVSYPRFRR